MAPTPTPKVTAYLGTWRIGRYSKAGFGSAALTDRFAESQVGKAMTLRRSSASFDPGFLWLGGRSCKTPSYTWASDNDFIGHAHQALLAPDHVEKRHDLLFLDVNCDGSNAFGCEITVHDECVAYYDGYSFFLGRVIDAQD